ncbi:hypothetical protein OUZ56_006075 [Daphnia magna]|uniref:Uncharacterized protein n=1 Tax=Daphnia magna TaxID=35525 RepID=A0ABQ9YUK2_9CRUS|nr:hypothetical protein OUZ56_006075 [Daphnia magna]
MENQDHEEILASDDYEDDISQTTDHFEGVNVSQQQADVVSIHRKIISLTQKNRTTKHNQFNMKQLTKTTPHAPKLRQPRVCHPSQKKRRQLRTQNYFMLPDARNAIGRKSSISQQLSLHFELSPLTLHIHLWKKNMENVNYIYTNGSPEEELPPPSPIQPQQQGPQQPFDAWDVALQQQQQQQQKKTTTPAAARFRFRTYPGGAPQHPREFLPEQLISAT